MADIFISYKREDKSKAALLASILEKTGYSVWWDTDLLGGEDYDVVIERELALCICVVVIWSSLSVISRNVKDEAKKALNRNKLVPVTFDNTEPPIGFGMTHTIIFSNSDKLTSGEKLKLTESIAKKINREPTIPVSLVINEAKVPHRRIRKTGIILLVILIVGVLFFTKGKQLFSGKDKTRNERTESDSLSFAEAFKLYQNDPLDNEALRLFSEYLQKFPKGKYIIEANFYTGEAYNKRQDWNRALKGYDFVIKNATDSFLEKSLLMAARIAFFETKDYYKSRDYFSLLYKDTLTFTHKWEALRGLVRSQYQVKDWIYGEETARKLFYTDSASQDDKAIAAIFLGNHHRYHNQHRQAISFYDLGLEVSRGAMKAQCQYSIAQSYFDLKELQIAEREANKVIRSFSSYENWSTRGYILLGDIFFAQKDYFNAKATLQSVIENSTDLDLRDEAKLKLSIVLQQEKKK